MNNIEVQSQNRERRKEIIDLLNPRTLPEAGFQSYEMLNHNALSKREAFLSGESRNPELQYPLLEHNLSSMDEGILNIAAAVDRLEHIVEDEEEFEAIKGSLGYRMSEMDFIKVLGQLHFASREGDVEYARELAETAKTMSERLYGKPDPEVVDAVLNTIWLDIDSKNFTGKAAQLRDDLVYGFTSAEGHHIPPLRRADDSEAKLPEFDEAVRWAGEYFEERDADIEAIVREFWDEKVEEAGESYKCYPADIIEAFQRVIDLRDPDGKYGVSVVPAEGKTALAWETPLMAVQVGTKRDPIENSRLLFTRIHHEFGHHGQKAINGFMTGLPVLGTGLYTANCDYLTAEEGIATLAEAGMDGSQAEWSGARLNYYLGVDLANTNGDDFRSVFEKTWRYNLLRSVDDSEDVSEEMILSAQSKAYNTCMRIFRGTPTTLRELTGIETVVTYNKDIAYLPGIIKAMTIFRKAYESNDSTLLDFVMTGKFDPTDDGHVAIVQRALLKQREQV